ncbi:MAG: chemotaxis protein CheB [Bacteroidota bacterium]|nr:chemotaxis protein CheB [Bacteroidota bacterium]
MGINGKYKVIVIGGSAGSFPVIVSILNQLNSNFQIPIVMCLHRLKQFRHGFVEALSLQSNIKIIEPDDKTSIKPGCAYLAPANYHLLAELGYTFALSTDEMHKFSRPSIDLTFETFSYAYREKMVGIILSGANNDGATGLLKCKKRGGLTIIQNPKEASVKTMVEGCLNLFQPDMVLNTNEIIRTINS